MVASPPILAYYCRNILRDSSKQVVRHGYISIVKYVGIYLFTFVTASREGLIISSRISDGTLGPGGRLLPLLASVRLIHYILVFFYILKGTSIDSFSGYMT